MPAPRRIAPHIRAEFISAALLQIALIVLWLTTQPHTFDGVTMFVGLCARAIAIACILRGIWLYRPRHQFAWWLMGARFAWSFFFTPIRNLWIKDWLWWQVDSAVGTLCYIAVAAPALKLRLAGTICRHI